jgi:type VI secretion system protein ImpA
MPLRDDLLKPIPGDNPSGANLRYDPVTDKIKEARREDLDVPQGDWKTALKAADYPLVIKLASDATSKRGKDLQIAVWLVDAHVRKEGFAVLADALLFLRDLMEQFWDTLYPPLDDDGDMEVRAAPLVWLGAKLGEPLGFLPIVSGKLNWHKYQESRLVGYEADADTGEKQQARQNRINENKITAEQFDEAIEDTAVSALRETYRQLTEAKTAVETLSEYCDQQFGDFSPSFIKTRDTIDEIAQTVHIILGRKPGGLEEEAPPAEEELDAFSVGLDSTLTSPEPKADDTDESTESTESEESTDSGGSEEPAMASDSGDVAGQLASICRSLRSEDPADPTPYSILRSFAWAKLISEAPQLEPSVVEAPESALRKRLKHLDAVGDWDQLLEGTEEAMALPCGRYWLDVQRYSFNALEHLDRSPAAKVVGLQLRTLLEALPDLVELTFPDDTPAANSETRNWIEGFIVKPAAAEPAGSDDSSASTDETPSDAFSSEETPSDDMSSMDIGSEDSTSEPEPEPEPAPEPEPYTVEENPPIMDEEQPPPSDTSDEFAMALQAVRDGRTAEGLGMITGILATERSGRARFRRRTQLAHLLMAAGKGKVAQPMLDQLAAEIEERRLEEWEQSEVIAYPLELLMHCLTSADDERRAQLYTRICKLDPVRAVNCSF